MTLLSNTICFLLKISGFKTSCIPSRISSRISQPYASYSPLRPDSNPFPDRVAYFFFLSKSTLWFFASVLATLCWNTSLWQYVGSVHISITPSRNAPPNPSLYVTYRLLFSVSLPQCQLVPNVIICDLPTRAGI